jgi:hypothetical protein
MSDTLGPLMERNMAQNIPFGLARGMFGAINGAELFGSSNASC